MAEVRFQLDEHLGRAVANGLRRRGVEAATTAELGLRGATDEQQAESALQSARVIATFDPDFIRLHNAGAQHAGIVFFGEHSRAIGQMIESLQLVAEVYQSEDMIQRLERF